jgi:polyhydroxybutyrate depolymerase
MTLSRETLRGADQRGYLLAVPAAPPTVIILSLHGTRSRASEQARLSRLDALGVPVGAAVAFPQAVQPIGRGYEWNHETDMDYVSRLVEHLIERFPTAGGQVCITGMSGGARMSCYFASLRPDVVSLVGAVGGLRAPSAPVLLRPVPVMAFHGTADRINPYNGSGTDRWRESVPDAARAWAAANGAASEPATVQVSAHVSQTTYGTVGARDETALWTVAGGGHTWPGSSLGLLGWLFLGKTTREIDATKLIVASTHLSSPR